jgi:hypothetical protein
MGIVRSKGNFKLYVRASERKPIHRRNVDRSVKVKHPKRDNPYSPTHKDHTIGHPGGDVVGDRLFRVALAGDRRGQDMVTRRGRAAR